MVTTSQKLAGESYLSHPGTIGVWLILRLTL